MGRKQNFIDSSMKFSLILNWEEIVLLIERKIFSSLGGRKFLITQYSYYFMSGFLQSGYRLLRWFACTVSLSNLFRGTLNYCKMEYILRTQRVSDIELSIGQHFILPINSNNLSLLANYIFLSLHDFHVFCYLIL